MPNDDFNLVDATGVNAPTGPTNGAATTADLSTAHDLRRSIRGEAHRRAAEASHSRALKRREERTARKQARDEKTFKETLGGRDIQVNGTVISKRDPPQRGASNGGQAATRVAALKYDPGTDTFASVTCDAQIANVTDYNG